MKCPRCDLESIVTSYGETFCLLCGREPSEKGRYVKAGKKDWAGRFIPTEKQGRNKKTKVSHVREENH